MQKLLKRNTGAAAGPLPGLPGWLSELLTARGIDTPEKAEAFLYPEKQGFNDPFLLHDMDRAVALLRRAKEEGVRTVVYGDYDVDGICACAIMHQTLCTFGLDAAVYIPDRHEEGYGLNAEAVRAISEKAGMLVTVDCGITGAEEVKLARDLGMKVIVTDHHTLPPQLPEADAVIDPLMPPYPFPSLCGAGVAFQLCRALLGDRAAESCLDLAALATVADLVPLLNENRLIVQKGLRALDQTVRPGLRALKQVSGVPERMRSEHIAFGLAPRLNACGRLESALTALSLIQESDEDRALQLALQLQRLNDERKALEMQVQDDAEEQLALFDLSRDRAIVICGEGYESGVVGLAAGRLAEKTGYPTIILSHQGDLAVGSARSAGDVDIYQALFQCRRFFQRFGGHRQAAGMTLAYADVPAFREALNEVVRGQLDGRALIPTKYYDARLSLSDVSAETVRRMALLEPYGMGNPEPVFLLREVGILSARAVGSNFAHLKLSLVEGSESRDAIAFRMGDLAGHLPHRADVLMTPVENRFRDRVSYECRVSAIQGDPESVETGDEKIAAALWQDFCLSAENNYVSPPASWSEETAGRWTGEVQGTLVFCRTRETAMRWHRRCPQLDVAFGPLSDRRAYSAIVCGVQAGDIRAPYRRVILADGDLTGKDQSLFEEAAGREWLTAPKTEALQSWMRENVPSLDDMRKTYALLRARPPLRSLSQLALERETGEGKEFFSLSVLNRLGLIDLTWAPFSASVGAFRKADPGADPVYRLLNGWKEAE